MSTISYEKRRDIFVRLATLFSGGLAAPEQALKQLGISYENVFACEFDKYARENYLANHKIDLKHFHKDINDLDATVYKDMVDIVVGGSPCQDFSIAGLRSGLKGKRGSLIYQFFRIIKEVQPEIFIYENVKGMVSDNNGKTLKDFLEVFRSVGYYCHSQILNTKDYDVPQNRERLYIIGFLDYDQYLSFDFAPIQKSNKSLKDILETDVDKKYYINRKLDTSYTSQSNTVHDTNKPMPTICAGTHGYALGYVKCVGLLDTKGHDIVRRVHSPDGLCPTLTMTGGGNQEPKIIQKPRGFNKGAVSKICPTITMNSWQENNYLIEPKIIASRGRNPDNPKSRQPNIPTKQMFEINERGTSNTLTTVQKDNYVLDVDHSIRKLTPRECFRLQGCNDDFKIVVSNSQAYKIAGNAMSVNILEMIFTQLLNPIRQNNLFNSQLADMNHSSGVAK